MTYKLIFVFFISIFILASCDSNDDDLHDCSFEQIDNNQGGIIDVTEQSLISQCNQSLLTTKSEIENNLIGEWELIGYGNGWSPTISKPCISIKISQNNLLIDFADSNSSSISDHAWEIIETATSTGEIHFRLNMEPVFNIGVSKFCDAYMYGDSTPRDGNMYLFEKVN